MIGRIELIMDQQQRQQFGKLFVEFQSTANILQDDFLTAWNQHQKLEDESSHPFVYRTVVRTFFPYVEFVSHGFRQVARTFPQSHYTFTPKETEQLQPDARIKTKDGIKIAFKAMANAFALDTPNFDDHRFGFLMQATGYRDRFMHPKTSDDLAVTLERAQVFADGGEWFSTEFTKTLNSANDNLVDAMRRKGLIK